MIFVKVVRRRRLRKTKTTYERGYWPEILAKVAGRNHDHTTSITFHAISEAEYNRRMHPRLF